MTIQDIICHDDYKATTPEEYYPVMSSSPSSISSQSDTPRRTRTILTAHQSRVLKRVLDQTLFPSTELRNNLAEMLGIKSRTIQIWFQNQRAKARMKKEISREELKSNDQDVLINNGSVKQGPTDIIWHGPVRKTVPVTTTYTHTQSIHCCAYSNTLNLPTHSNSSSTNTNANNNNNNNNNNFNINSITTRQLGLDILASIASMTNSVETEMARMSNNRTLCLAPITPLINGHPKTSLPPIEGAIAFSQLKR